MNEEKHLDKDELMKIADDIKDTLGSSLFLTELLLGLSSDELQFQLKEIDRAYDMEHGL